MFQSQELEDHLKTSDTIQVEAAVYSEWNMNQPDNIARLGNYRYRPTYSSSQYFLIPMSYDAEDIGNYYTGATDSDIAIDSGFDDNDQPTLFISPKEKMKLLYSLEDCIKPHRPRSGINKPLYLGVDEVNQLPVKYTVTNKVKSGGIATLTIGSHLLSIGDQIYVSILDANFNGTYLVSNVGFDPITKTNTTVSYASTGTVASSSASGTVTQISDEPFFKPSQFITNPSPIDKVTKAQMDNQSYIVNRPRYYMSHKDDLFKYWTSFRTEYGMPTPRPGMADIQVLRQVERGVSFSLNNRYYIEDAAPFVVYKDQVPVNKIAVKMQTNVGDVDLGNLRYNNKSLPDPLHGDTNKTTPIIWRIEKLNKDSSWETIVQFDEESTRSDGTPIIGLDGYAEVSYGLQVPEEYSSIFVYAGILSNASLLPQFAPTGYSFLVKEEDHEMGTMWIYINDEWISFSPQYSWKVSDETINYNSKFVTSIANPDYFTDVNGLPQFREFEWILGMRIVVETMNKNNCTFDLIEMSPRLTVDISESVASFSITKTMSDLGNGSVPVGSLSASTGKVDIFDSNFSFNNNNTFNFENNTGSILAGYLDMPVKFLFYDITRNVGAFDYFVPVKTMYSNSFPQVTGTGTIVGIELRDFFFYLESMPAPQLLLTDVSLSWAITVLLDYAGFTNYTFKRIQGYPEIVIPYFFVEPDQNVAEVLQKLAVASQSAMFFDEYNNFIVMSKEYILPRSEDERETDTTLYGQVEQQNLPNIINLTSQDKLVYNDGQINYTVRYIQRSIGSTKTAQMLDQYKQYIYKPVLLWEVQGRESTKTINQLGAQNSGYTLGAVPLGSNLSGDAPYVANNFIVNNIIDVGENIYWIPSYSGYFYANAEVIKFDAVEYVIAGQSSPVWITSNQQYQDYFSRLPFNGKMFPTGNIRIYTKPEYEIVNETVNLKSGQIKEHGRGQFGTPITSHPAGVSEYWSDNGNVRGCIMDSSKYLFTTGSYIEYPENLVTGIAGKIQEAPYLDADIISQSSTRNGIIKNFLAEKYATEEEVNYYKTTGPGTVQSSALVVNGPKFTEGLPASSFISYVYKDFVDQDGQATPYKHFGTRMRIVGKIESGTDKSQTPSGAFPIFQGSSDSNGNLWASSPALSPSAPDQEIKIFGGSGGLGFSVNKETNNGYFFEIVALTADSVDQYATNNSAGVKIAKILSSPKPSCVSNEVTVYTENQFDFQVGESVLISGLVDENDPTNTRTPLNGDYAITAIGTDKKSFKYVVTSSPSLTTTSSTGAVASQSLPETSNVANMYFYKILSDGSGKAIPVKLWSGLSQINVDSGDFIGQNRLAGESGTTIYDLAAEYVNIGTSRRFFLYLNGKQIATIDDVNPLPEYNNMAIFIRGSSRCMFENVYALANNYSQNSSFAIDTGVSQVFTSNDIDASEALRKYALSGMIQKTYLSGINSFEPPAYRMYFEEFGTIMREAAYFNIKYDRAYPALYAKLAKTLNNMKGYTASGFYSGSYGADFLIFNCTDFNLNLDDTSGNYLRIHGIAFTQDTTYTLTVNDYFKKKSVLSDSEIGSSSTLVNPIRVLEEYNTIKNSRIKYGVNEFTPIESPYIQSNDSAEDVFGWIIEKLSVPKKTIGINTFATTNLQLGDIVTIDYKDEQGEGINIISPEETRFVIYNMEYSKDQSGLTTTLYLVEV